MILDSISAGLYVDGLPPGRWSFERGLHLASWTSSSSIVWLANYRKPAVAIAAEFMLGRYELPQRDFRPFYDVPHAFGRLAPVSSFGG